MPQPWPPAGHGWSYRVREELDGYTLEYDLTLPSAVSDFDQSTARVGRHGGSTAADRSFRSELFGRIGAVTVAGGEVETAMKRLLLLLRGEGGGFSVVDMTWTALHRGLLDQCTGTDDRRRALAESLAWGDETGAKRRRDNVIHAYWWLFAGCGVRRSRFHRKSDGTVMLYTPT